MTQLEMARNNEISREIEVVAEKENMDARELMKKIANGRVVIPASKLHKNFSPIGIGEGLITSAVLSLVLVARADLLELQRI